MSDFMAVANSFGVPVAVMTAMLWFFWTVLRWVKPLVEQLLGQLVSAHVATLNAINEQNKLNAANLSKLATESVCRFEPSHCRYVSPGQDVPNLPPCRSSLD